MKGQLRSSAGASLHLCMTPHGPDAATFEAAVGDARSGQQQQPTRLPADTLAFMFETDWTPRVTMSVRCGLLGFRCSTCRAAAGRRCAGLYVQDRLDAARHDASATARQFSVLWLC